MARMFPVILLCLYLYQIRYIYAAGKVVAGHKTCSEIKLYPVLQMTIKIENISYNDFKHYIYDNKTRIKDLFHGIEHSLDYSYNKTYHYPKHLSDMLAHCKTYAYKLEYENMTKNGFKLFYDMESYDNEYKYKMEKLLQKKYFKQALYHEFEYYFHKYHIPNYNNIYVNKVTVINTSLTLETRLTAFGIMIGVIVGIFTVSGVVIFFYNKTEKHRKHLREIADEFGFEDISEVSQITHFKLF
eukprot:129004_1